MSVPINDGGPAFPRSSADHGSYGHSEQDGMTLRDWFAGQALAGIINIMPNEPAKAAAMAAYMYADAMIAARGDT